MKGRELQNLGVPQGPMIRLTLDLCRKAADAGLDRDAMRSAIRTVVTYPEKHRNHQHFGRLAEAILEERANPSGESFTPRDQPAPWKQWGTDLDHKSIEQLRHACDLPVSIAGALMPDAHVGYGLPIGGVLATDNAVIPYAVGVDIACRMKMTVLDLPPHTIRAETDRLINALEDETSFGVGASFKGPKLRQHPVMDDDWSITTVTKQNRDKAWRQLGTSGSGNHFVEYGLLKLDAPALGLEPGEYLALLSHSGSRGAGAAVASHYSKLAMDQHPELPRQLKHLAWLDLDTEAGQEYWQAMNLMGRYAAANHAMIHKHVAKALKADVLADVENHHNFAWKETHTDPNTGEQRAMIVHRKGATPAGRDVLGIIPGSMASPCYVVRGKGSSDALDSAAHGAGRVMSRKQAKSSFTWSDVKKQLKQRDVLLLSAGLDEVPGVYKNIDEVMAEQQDLVDTIARFDPKIVKMAPAGERPED